MYLTLSRGKPSPLVLKIAGCTLLTGALTACHPLTYGIVCDYENNTYNAAASVEAYSEAKWTCDEDGQIRTLRGNGIPDHLVGVFPNEHNPHTITKQEIVTHVTLEPEVTKVVKPIGGADGALGYALNSVKIDPGTTGSCSDSDQGCGHDDGNWNIETIGQTSFNFGIDENNGHVQPDGAYHYHGLPHGFIAKIRDSKIEPQKTDMTLFGWAADGHAIYAEYGSIIESSNIVPLKKMKSSYRLVEEISESRPSIDIYPLGTFKEDWEYVRGLGDLDECNGDKGATPEFSQMIYHYVATETYPYSPRCVKGYLDFPVDKQPPSANIEPSLHK